MRAVDVQLFAVADDGPIGFHILSKHAELDKRAELADHVQPLRHAGRVAGCLDVHVAAVAVRQVENSLQRVRAGGIQHEVSTEFGCERPAFGVQVHANEFGR